MTGELHEIVKQFDNAMLVTRVPSGHLHARPMVIALSDSKLDVWFLSDMESGKIDEIASNPDVAVVMQKDGKFFSLSGTAELIQDQTKIRELWTPDLEEWFAEDAELVAVKVNAVEARFWGSHQSDSATLVSQEGLASASLQHTVESSPVSDY